MRTATCAEVRTDFADDSVKEHGEIVQFAGRNVATAIQEMIAALGYRVSEPENGDEHGWWLHINHEDRQFWVQVTDLPPDVMLMIEDVTFFLNRWFSKNGHLYGEFVRKLKAAIEADPRFHHIDWFEQDKNGRVLGPDRKPLSTKELQARSLARKAALPAGRDA
jgi:hypothetical protein